MGVVSNLGRSTSSLDGSRIVIYDANRWNTGVGRKALESGRPILSLTF